MLATLTLLCGPAGEPCTCPVSPWAALCERFPSTTLGVAAKDPEGLFPRPLLWVCYTSLSPSLVSLVSASCRFDIASFGWELEETASLRAVDLLARGLGEHASPLACWRLRPGDLKLEFLFQKRKREKSRCVVNTVGSVHAK